MTEDGDVAFERTLINGETNPSPTLTARCLGVLKAREQGEGVCEWVWEADHSQ